VTCAHHANVIVLVASLASSQCYVRDARQGALAEACMLCNVVTSASVVCESHSSISYGSLLKTKTDL